jgi:hypothetical protein
MWTNCVISVLLLKLVFEEERIPQSVHTAVVSLQFVDNVEVLHPSSVAIDASNIRILLALLSNFPLHQAVIDCVLHDRLYHAAPAATRVVVRGWVGMVVERRTVTVAIEGS